MDSDFFSTGRERYMSYELKCRVCELSSSLLMMTSGYEVTSLSPLYHTTARVVLQATLIPRTMKRCPDRLQLSFLKGGAQLTWFRRQGATDVRPCHHPVERPAILDLQRHRALVDYCGTEYSRRIRIITRLTKASG